ncbi:MAG TPA: glycosyltransferase [Longimicrobiales bacterium]
MRIAFFVGEFPALSETFILNQVTGLIDLGHEVDLYAMRRRGDPKVHPEVSAYGLLDRARYVDMPGRALPYAAGAAPRLVRNLLRDPKNTIRSLDARRFGKFAATLRLLYASTPFLGRMPIEYDILHCHFGPHGVYAVKLRDFGAFRGKIVTSFHGFDVGAYPRATGGNPYHELFRSGDLFLANSRFTERRLRDLGCPADRLVVHPVGIDVARFRSPPRRRSAGGPVRLLTVTRLVEEKGVAYGIRAVAELRRRRPTLELVYDIVGDGPLAPELRALAARLGVEAHVRLAGWANHAELPGIYASADLFLLPSIRTPSGAEEGAGMVLLEAQAASLPIVATRVGGIPEVVRDGVSAILVPERDAVAIADAVEDLVARRGEWDAMGRAGRQYVAGRFDIRSLNAELIRLYEGLPTGPGGRERTARLTSPGSRRGADVP